jgi:hypothetical protein
MWTVGLQWDPSILQMQDNMVEGSFLKSGGGTLFVTAPINASHGYIPEMTSSYLSTKHADGSGTLVTVSFKLLALGNSKIEIINPVLLGSLNATFENPPIPFTTINATLSMIATPTPTPTSTSPSQEQNVSHPPVAKFLPVDGTSYSIGDMVTLDANQSLNGYDTVTANESCPIVAYNWRVEYLNGTLFNSFSGKTNTFNASVTGELRIILIIEAQDTHPPSSLSFKTTDTATSIIHVNPEVAKANLDVFTDRGGLGYNVSSHPYGPQELIKVYAVSTYRNVSVPNVDVVFTLKDSKGTDLAYRVARTNSSGFASADFRLPWLDTDNPESAFGNWSIVATGSISQYSVKDVVPFIFSYIVTTKNISTLGAVSLSAEVPINITINRLSNMSVWSYLTVTVFDSHKQPLGSFVYSNNQQSSENFTVQAKIKIPSWSYLGQATAYINVLTTSPENAGVPYCPETIVNFAIIE